MTDKVIITNQSALKELYKSNYDKVIDAIDRLIAADASKQIKSHLIFIDDEQQMADFQIPAVSNVEDDKANKNAVDAIYKSIEPDYILLLGGPDVIPHQKLENPIKREKFLVKLMIPTTPADLSVVPSDLPYACDAPYSTEVEDFLNPTRVVGRLAGVTGSDEAEYLINPIEASIESSPVEKEIYEKYFSVATKNPQPELAGECLEDIFNNNSALKMSPPESSDSLSKDELKAMSHFVVCHGVPNFPYWIGEDSFFDWLTKGRKNGENRFEISLEPKNIDNVIQPQTIAAAINCFGANLYDPQAAPEAYFKQLDKKLKKIDFAPGELRIPGMCNTYLKNKAIAFCGSTSLAYEPGIIEEFMNNLLEGASVGRAFLQSRQTFIRLNPKMNKVDLKTIAEFILLGDPSAHPIVKQKDTFMESLLSMVKETKAEVAERKDRRKALKENGEKVAEKTLVTKDDQEKEPGKEVKSKIDELIKSLDLKETEVESHSLKHNKTKEEHAENEKVHILSGIHFDEEHDLFPKIVKRIIHEKDDKLVSVKKVQSM